MSSTAPETGERRRMPRRISVGTGVVGLLAGLLFATNASVFAGDSLRQPQNLEGLARAETERLEEIEAENAALREQIAELTAGEEPVSDGPAGSDVPAAAVGLEAVHGPGLEVQLWDAPPIPEDDQGAFAPDALVVHQQDIEAVMNALWAGGAEAMSIQGHRVVSTTGVRCVGNVLHIAGRTYSPPYVIRAIGDQDSLQRGLDAAAGVQVYLQYVEAVGLGWSVTEEEDIELPAYTGPLALQHAEVLADRN
ncbi:DUF881 domain-containing protein [Georgenia halophila]|uniref:DUF881 domain-containing protein n=1 Tax=Georgenia halophila TaxID=620889 RepID=A0ABP8LIT2_9MICO